ncbi:hypothetical protein DM01DRAFT_1114713 [Hesseltinella vesiculosa]|uniref:Galactose oxidase n=1 Tax=Hesseltinella vesiculosa TaxID=101127 RepID=A0A1X2GA25_9FUNG|nr:hypothetical protein DM01DRAFT_1114713 [Hesseltinella vesiculosa]
MYENRMYVFGGSDGERMYNDIWAFDFQTRSWSQIPAAGFIPAARDLCGVALVDDAMYIIGGRDSEGLELNDLCAFRIRSQRWYIFKNMGSSPTARHSLSMTAVKDKMFVVGGDMRPGVKHEDIGGIYILDSSKIKYPPEASIGPTHQQGGPSPQGHMPNVSPTSSSLSLPDPDLTTPSSATPARNYTPSPSQIHPSQSSPTVHTSADVYQNPSQQVFSNINHDPYQHHATTVSGGQSAKSTRHVSYFPEHQQHQNQPSRPPRHASSVPEAALRRPRTASPLPPTDEPHELPEASPYTLQQPSQTQLTMHIDNADPPSQDQARQSPMPMSNGSGNRSAPGIISPPPRPSREGVQLNQALHGRMADVALASFNDVPQAQVERSPMAPLTASEMPSASYASQTPITLPQDLISHQANAAMSNSHPLAEEKILENITAGGMASSRSLSPATMSLEEPSRSTAVSDNAGNGERATLLREIKARDLIISEMKKKEQWWRTEVSLARKQRPRTMVNEEDGANEDELMLMSLSDLENDKLKLFEQLVTVKAELRRVRANITQYAQPMSDKVASAERMRTAALQEAMYFKSKYQALKSQLTEHDDDDHSRLTKIHDQRVQDLEEKLVVALAENEKNVKLMQQWQRKAQHDHNSKQSAEERSKEAHARAEEAQKAYQNGLEELDIWHTRATKSEHQYQESQAKISDLTSQLSQAFQAVAKSAAEAEMAVKEKQALLANPDAIDGDRNGLLAENQLKIARLEANHLKARNEAATLQQRLAEAMDDIAKLKAQLAERDDSLQEAHSQLEDADIQLNMIREAMHQHQNQFS